MRTGPNTSAVSFPSVLYAVATDVEPLMSNLWRCLVQVQSLRADVRLCVC